MILDFSFFSNDFLLHEPRKIFDHTEHEAYRKINTLQGTFVLIIMLVSINALQGLPNSKNQSETINNRASSIPDSKNQPEIINTLQGLLHVNILTCFNAQLAY